MMLIIVFLIAFIITLTLKYPKVRSITPNVKMHPPLGISDQMEANELHEKVSDLRRVIKWLQDEYLSLKSPENPWWTEPTFRFKMNTYELYLDKLNKVRKKLVSFDTDHFANKVAYEQLTLKSYSHSPKFDEIHSVLEDTTNALHSFSKNLESWIELMAEKHAITNREHLWDQYQRQTVAFAKQKQGLLEVKRGYVKKKEELQQLEQLLRKENKGSIPKPIQIDSTPASLTLQNPNEQLYRLRMLQIQVAQQKKKVVGEKQKLEVLEFEVNKYWLAYEQAGGNAKVVVEEVSPWISFDPQNEEAFWQSYEQMIAQNKGLRQGIIQMAG